jgi:hypothetical protein
MKKITLLALLLMSSLSNAQIFKFNPDGSSEYVVFQAGNQTAKELYTKTLNWINETYKNPENVIKAKIENEMIRIEGFNYKVFTRTFPSGTIAEYDALYTMEMQFQDGKYRVKYTHNETRIDGGKVFFKFEDMLANKPDQNGNAFENGKAQYENNVYELMNSLHNYLIKQKEKW